MDLVNRINAKYVQVSNNVTHYYEKVFGIPCDIYLPIFPTYDEEVLYKNMKIFAPHEASSYPTKPTYSNLKFYIPNLIPKEAFNSAETEFDSMRAEDDLTRPFIETTKKRELPIQTKVVVKQGQSISKFFIDKKMVVTGANGFMVLRMYLSPLTKDNDNSDEPTQEEFIPTEESTSSLTMVIPDS